MPLLLERLRRALAPQFTVLREIASGGMGLVYLGHDVALDRPVAIKVLRPELATAVGAERFLREARILARLHHPHIVPVFQGGEVDGLLYHVLEYQDGETLAQRLSRGPLTATEVGALTDGLLGALQAAHSAGVVHRDIKPSNIFLVAGRAVVGDFGIASTATAEETLTQPGAALGTRAYMAPEQLRGGATSPQTDLYAAGLVVLEAITGRRPVEVSASGGGGRMRGVPRRMGAGLRRALAEDPGDRWPSAEAMRAGLRGGRVRPRVVAGLVVVAGLAWILTPSSSGPPAPGRFVVGIGAFAEVAPSAGARWGDSLRVAVTERLAGFPDFVVDRNPGGSATLSLSGSVDRRGDSLRVELFALTPDGRSRPLVIPSAAIAGWRSLVDSMVREVLLAIWVEDPGEGSSLPRGAVPQTPLGTERWLSAELLYRDGEWDAARRAYEDAEAVDRTCLLCAYRIRDLDRWLNRGDDTTRLRSLLANLPRFPEEYGEVIRASARPPRERIAALRELATRRRDFFDVQYLLGDELLHRGPLVGIPRHEAIGALRTARRLRPDFAGVAEHLAWALTTEGDGDSARAILDDLGLKHPPRDDFTRGLRAFHELAWWWRYRSTAEAADWTRALFTQPAILTSPYLPAGPRALPALGVVTGAVGFGHALESLGPPELVRAGQLARLFGHTALGQLSEALAVEEALRSQLDDPRWRLVPLQLWGLLALAGDSISGGVAATGWLERLSRRRDLDATLRARIAWTTAMRAPPAPPERDETPLDRLLAARYAAATGDPSRALMLTDTLTDQHYGRHDPSAGAAARLLRAAWFGQLDRHAEAARELLWHEHSDFAEIPRDEVQAAEFDWAVGTVAMWQRARHLEAEGEGGRELCRMYAEVARRWEAADAPLAARRDSARAGLAARGCGRPG